MVAAQEGEHGPDQPTSWRRPLSGRPDMARAGCPAGSTAPPARWASPGPADPFPGPASSLRTVAPNREAGRMQAQTTLLDLVTAVSDVTDSEDEVVATVVHLVNSGAVRLCGTFRGARFD